MPRNVLSTITGLVGAAAGGALGMLAFSWALRQGFYALMLPGFSLGLGCYGLSRHASRRRGVACGLAGVALGLVAEWRHRPFINDEGLAYFLAHVYQLNIITLIMVAIGGAMAFHFGKDHYLAARKAEGPEI
jgi:hypothetical protein